MPQPLFPRWATPAARAALALALVGAVAVPAAMMGWVRTRWSTGQGRAPQQPVAFDHRLHAGDFRIDCLYCHATAEGGPAGSSGATGATGATGAVGPSSRLAAVAASGRPASAGLPATEICVSCHQPVWLKGPGFAAVRRSLAKGRPIAWRRVHLLPGYVYFDHGAHTRHGIGCESCHGRVDRMARVRQEAPLTMGWCLDCHQSPERQVRPLAEVTTMGWRPPGGSAQAAALHRQLARRYGVQSRTACVTCHR